MKRLFVVVMVLLALSALMISVSHGAAVHKQKSGLNYIDPSLVQEGYPVFNFGYQRTGNADMVMIDLYGNVVHYWHSNNWADLKINSLAWPLIYYDTMILDCDYKDQGTFPITPSPLVRGARNYDTIVQLDWDSNIMDSSGYALIGANYAPHHCEKRIWNKALQDYTWLALGWQAYGPEDAVALGTDPVYEADYTGSANRLGWSPDCLLEVDANGNLVWRWSFADHIVQNYDATKTAPFTDAFGYPNPGATYGNPADFPGKLNINQMTDNLKGPSYDWNHCNSMDYNPTLGHIVVNAKDFSEIYVIDHDGTFVSTDNWEANWQAAQSDAGDFLYRFGNPHNYGQGEFGGYRDEGNHQFWGAHNIHWIGETAGSMYNGFADAFGVIPGEGDLIIFDNNCWDPTEHASNILQWNPFIGADGTDTGWYVNPPDAGYNAVNPMAAWAAFGGTGTNSLGSLSKQTTWRYNGGTGFYSFHISGMMRMPNGNTHVCSGTQGHLFEVTPNGPNGAMPQVAWEYYPPSLGEFSGNAIFRSNKVPAGHPLIEGKDLTPICNLREHILQRNAGPSAAIELQKFLGTF